MIRVPRLRSLIPLLVLLLLVGLIGQQVVLRWRAAPVLVGTVMIGLDAWALAVDVPSGHVFVSNSSAGTLSVLDAGSGTVLHTIALTGIPNQIAVDGRTRRAFVLNDATNTMSVLDAATGTLVQTLHFTAVHDLAIDEARNRVLVVGLRPDGASEVSILDARSGRVRRAIPNALDSWGLALDARSGRVLVTNRGDGTLSVLDAARGHVVRTVPVGTHPTGVVVDARDGHAFVANTGDSALATGGTISMLDARQGTVLRTVWVGRDPATVVVDASTSRVFVVHGRGGSKGLRADSGAGGTDVLDARSGRVLHMLAVGALPVDDVGTALYPHMVALDEQRGHLFVINRTLRDRAGQPTAGSVSVFDAVSGRVLHTIAVGWAPMALAVDETTARLFVVNKDGGGLLGNSQSNWAWVPHAWRSWLPFLLVPPRPSRASNVTVIDIAQL